MDIDPPDLDIDTDTAQQAVGILPRLAYFVVHYMFEGPGWYCGWYLCRLLSAGNFPETDVHDSEDAPWPTRIAVDLVGPLTLGTVILLTARLILGPAGWQVFGF